jgi:hypothetical protein
MLRVKASGGEPEPLFHGDPAAPEVTYAEPELFADGRALLYTALLPEGRSRVEARRLDGSAAVVVAEGGLGGRYLPPGFLLYSEGDRVMAVRFDAAGLRVVGTPAPVFEGAFTSAADGVSNIETARDGTVVYVAGRDADSQRRPVWVDRSGKRLGPAVEEFLEAARNPRQRVYMLYGSDSGPRVRSLPADGSVLEPESVTPEDLTGVPLACSPDGAFLIFGNGSRNSLLPLRGGTPRPWPGTPFREMGADFSPDSRFVAYASDPSGRLEIYVRPFPGPGAPVRVSGDGGHDPQWSHDGGELFFRGDDGVLAARVRPRGPVFRAEPPRVLFRGGFFRDPLDTGIRFYDVAPDGRFLMLEPAGDSTASVVLVQNWAQELERSLGR